MNRELTLPKRLALAAELVPSCVCFADVGCDHGYLSVYLLETGRVQRAIASDVNESPLASAEANLSAAGLLDRAILRLSDGFAGYAPAEAQAAAVCGMGGLLISHILEAADPAFLAGLEALILQPQTEPETVRRSVHALGFRIDAERFTEDRGKYYTLIRAVPGEESYTSEWDYRYGRLLDPAKDPVYRDWLSRKRQDLAAWADLARDPETTARLREEADWILTRLTEVHHDS